MNENIIHSKSIAELAQNMGQGKPTHPLIAIIDTAKLAFGEEYVGLRYATDMYCIALKDASCGMDYGRNHYDFNEGVMIFIGPGQVVSTTKPQALNEVQGWMLYFHPDLIRNTPLGEKIDSFTFFNYEAHEALHLSDQEQDTMTHCVNLIQEEINQRIDDHSQSVLVSNIELMLNYSQRYYQRQFNTRSSQNTDLAAKVESLLKEYYVSNKFEESGQPSVQYLAEACYVSPNYLSDLLTKETGRPTIDHINDFLIDKAKNLLLGSTDSISGVAYSLGFNYPHYFSRLFKKKEGVTPQEYRQSN